MTRKLTEVALESTTLALLQLVIFVHLQLRPHASAFRQDVRLLTLSDRKSVV
mgnify:CR=1 FL=1